MFCSKCNKSFFIGVVVVMLFFTGCMSTYDDTDMPMYSRADVAVMESSALFGYGRSDDIYVALSYIYNNDSLTKEHGENFEVTPEDIVCYTSEGSTFMFLGIYKGNAEYTVSVGKVTYHITLQKSWGESWRVEEFYRENL